MKFTNLKRESKLKQELKNLGEEVCKFTAYILPRRIAYFVMIRIIAEGTTGIYSNTLVPEVPAMEILKRWEKGKR